jgi:hypothetical protein
MANVPLKPYTHIYNTMGTIPCQFQDLGAFPLRLTLFYRKSGKVKLYPPLLKTFVWRLILLTLATAERAGRFSTHIDKHYTTCGAIKNDSHLFFLCDLPQRVWATSNTPISLHLINPDLDGVQHIILHLFSSNSTEQTLTKTPLLL